MMDSLWHMHLAGLLSANWPESAAIQSAGREILPSLVAITPEQLAVMRQLPDDERGELDMMVKAAHEYIDYETNPSRYGRRQRLNLQICKAKLQGYHTLQEKAAAITAGEAADELDALDVLLESVGDVSPDATADVVDNIMLACMKEMGLPEGGLSHTIADAMLARCYSGKGDERRVSAYTLQAFLLDLANRVEEFGVDNILLLHEKCGLVNFADMPRNIVQRMLKFANGDKELMNHLKSHEVCVLVKDASKDHNGAFKDSYHKFDTADETTLVFEVYASDSTVRTATDQFVAIDTQLQDNAIAPSVVVVGAHGRKGAVDIGGVDIGNKGDLSLEDSALLNIMMHMKPDRDGNCTIVYDSCSQDAAGDGGVDDTMLTRTAADLLAARKQGGGHVAIPGTYMIYGVKVPYTMKRAREGNFSAEYTEERPADSTSGISVGYTTIERVIVTEAGNVYRDLRKRVPEAGRGVDTTGEHERLPADLELPMFQRYYGND